MLIGCVQASDFYWIGSGDRQQSWTDSGNWQDGAVPASDSQSNVRFGGEGSRFAPNHHVTVDYPANDPSGNNVATTDLGSITFDNTYGTLPSVLVLDVNGAPGSTYQLITLYGGITLSNTVTKVEFSGRDSQLRLGADTVLNISTGATLQFDSNLSIFGYYGIIKDGLGTVTFDNQPGYGHPPSDNPYDPGFSVILNAGTLNINNNLGGGPFIINGGTIDNTSGQTVVGPYESIWNADVLFKGTNDLAFGSGGVVLTGDRTVDVMAGTLAIQGPVGRQDGQYAGMIHTLTKTGPGTLALLGTDYNSTNQIAEVYVNQGTLAISNPNDLGSGHSIVSIGDATLRIDGIGFKDDLHSYDIESVNSTIEVVGSAELNGMNGLASITGSGSLTFRGLPKENLGAGALILDSPAGFLGSVTIESGSIVARCDYALPSSAVLTIEQGGSFLLNGQYRLQLAGLIVSGDEPIDGRIIIGEGPASGSKVTSVATRTRVDYSLGSRSRLITPDERGAIESRDLSPSSAVTVSVTQSGSLLGGGSIDAGNGRIVIDGTLAPNGTMHLHSSSSDLGALTLTANSTVIITINDTGNDLIALGSTNLALGGGALALDLPNTSATGIDYRATYTIFSGVTTLTGSGFGAVTGYDSTDYLARFALVGTDYDLHFEPVPEASTWFVASLAAGALLLGEYSRRKRSLSPVSVKTRTL
ncbi:MAG: hypothetical protein M3Y69_10510 [Verrucomicrobiota bacterium]|nr:hypothetical protein [Verrucomicrobiota bacterium]